MHPVDRGAAPLNPPLVAVERLQCLSVAQCLQW